MFWKRTTDEQDSKGTAAAMPLDPTRPVGEESRKTYGDKISNGFFQRYLSGDHILEIGYRGYLQEDIVPIVPQAIGIDRDYPGYDGIRLPFEDGSIDAIYSSHCFEHISENIAVLRDWYRILKIGGYIVLVVPHQHLFEKKVEWPSFGNPDHAHFYTSGTLCSLIERAFEPNSFRIRSLVENDADYRYDQPPRAPALGCYEIEVVIEKITKPFWNLDDGSIRAYSAAELSTREHRPDRWSIDIDVKNRDGHVIWGPWFSLQRGDYVVDFEFEASGLSELPLDGQIIFEVSREAIPVAQVLCEGLEGRELLSKGSIRIPFDNPADAINIEFRISIHGTPYDGILKIKGAVLDYRR